MTNPAESGRKIRVLVVDDHLLMRLGLSFALNSEPDMQIVAEGEDGSDAVELYRSHRPDVVVLDLRMPKCNGIETIQLIRREFGGSRILVLSNYWTGDEVTAALQAGALGFVVKDTPLAGLLAAIRQVHAGEQFLPPEIARRLAGRVPAQLTARELDVLALVSQGRSNKEIGAELELAEAIVKAHVSGILSKLAVADRTQAILAGIRRGIIHIGA